MNEPSQPERNRPEKEVNITVDELTQIRDSLRGIRFGSVHVTIQDGVVVQIDRTEKRRLRRFREKIQ